MVIIMKDMVFEVIASYSSSRDFDSSMSLNQIGIDSLKLIGLIMDLEEKLEVTIPDQYMTEEWFNTPGSIVTLFEKILP